MEQPDMMRRALADRALIDADLAGIFTGIAQIFSNH
jgi:hypothetical protein